MSEIIDKWISCQPKEAPKSAPEVDVQLAKLLEGQSLATTARREYTDEEKKIRDAILSQYSQLSDNEVVFILIIIEYIVDDLSNILHSSASNLKVPSSISS